MADDQRQQNEKSALDAFEQANPAVFARARDNPAALKALSKIERRAAAIKEKAVQHAKNFQDRWVAKESFRIWQQRLAQQAKYPAPPGEERSVAPEEVMKMASRNVQARTARRLAKINGIKSRMSNAIVRNLDAPKLMADFNEAAQPDRKLRRTQ